jgi:hypothetical protein
VHCFEVRAIDDDDARDPTPCDLILPVRNSPPEVMIWDLKALPDTTIGAILIKWHGSDPDGDETIAGYLAWLDGNGENPIVLSPSDTAASLGFEDFGGDFDRERTVNIVAIDSGCDTSSVVSYTWYVREPVGTVLLVDDLSSEAGAAEKITDSFYRLGLDSCVGTYSVLDLEGFGGVDYGHNFAKLFGAFDLVIWYGGLLWRPVSPALSIIEGDLREYVEGGGSFLLQSLRAFGSGGSFTDSSFIEVFGVDSLYLNGGSTNFDCMRWIVQGNTEVGLDSVGVQSIFPGVECMRPSANALPLYHIPPGTVNKKQTTTYYLGILNPWFAGKAAVLTFPLSRSDQYGNARNQYCRIIDLMLY